jgi:uroporphyrinogen decarboxylase
MHDFFKTLSGPSPKKPFPLLSFPGIQLLGITVRDLIGSAENQARCMKAVAERFDCAASVSLMDLSVEAEAFGSTVRFSDGEVPTVTGAIVHSAEDARRLVVPPVGCARTGLCVEAISLAKERISDRPLFAGAIGPFSLSGRLMDMTEIMVKCLMEPEQTHLVLEKATAFISDYAAALKAAGADGLIIAEPAAGLLSPGVCETFSSRYVSRIVETVQDDRFSVIYHNCGNTLPLLASILGIGARAYHFGDAVDIGEILKGMPPERPVIGNLSPSLYLRSGTPDRVAAATREMMHKAYGYANYIPSTGCDIPPLSPLANIDAFMLAASLC